jgi:hypothetical protein
VSSSVVVDGHWGKKTTDAFHEFQASIGVSEGERVDYLEPSDPHNLLINLCISANVVMSIDTKKKGAEAFLQFFNDAVNLQCPYCWTAKISPRKIDHLIYGLAGYPDYIVFLTKGNEFELNPKWPIGFNCISFANAAISIARTGNTHSHPYDVSQMLGGYNPTGGRYNLSYVLNKPKSQILTTASHTLKSTSSNVKQVNLTGYKENKHVSENYFYNADEVISAVQPSRLYYLEWCKLETGFGHHDSILYNGDIYEANVPGFKPGSQVDIVKTDVASRMKMSPHDAVLLMGPV